MSKYHGLPDIDTAADVFETVDEPESSLQPSHEGGNDNDATTATAKSEHIDQSALPPRRGVEKAFGRSRRKDESYQLGLPPLARSSSSSSSEGISSSRPREAPAARIRRLKAELEEVEKELSQSASSPKSNEDNLASSSRSNVKRKSVLPPRKGVDLVGELSGLRKRLEGLDQEDGAATARLGGSVGGGAEERLRKLTFAGAGIGDGDAGVAPSDGNEPDQAREGVQGASVSDLDRRLASLEEVLGSTGEGLNQIPTSPLLPSLSKLDHLLSLLSQPRNLDVISRRLKLLLVDLDRAAASSRRNPNAQVIPTPSSFNVNLSAAEYAQLQTLFALLPRLDPLLPILPPLMARLRSLAGLHTEAGRVVEGLKKLEGDGTKRGEEVKELKAVVEAVREGVEEGGKRALGNWEAVERRMKDLEGRIAKLNED